VPHKKDRSHLFTYVLTIVLALVRWGAVRTWNLLTFWRKERKKPLPDRQKIDRVKAVTGLLAIAAGVGIAAWFVLGALGSFAAAFVSRQTVLYVGMALMIVGLNVARLMPRRRKLGLLLAAVGALLCAYGLGYLG